MAAVTADHTITNDAWTAVATGAANVFVQLKTHGPIRLVAAGTQPAADSKVGLVLQRDALAEVNLSGLGATDNVYCRGIDGDTETVAVITA